MSTIIEYISLGIYILVCVSLVLLTLVQNRRSEGLGAAITGQGDTSRGSLGREEKLSNLIRQLSWAFLAGSFIVSLILRSLWT